MLADEEVTLARYRFAPDASFDKAPAWLYKGVAEAFSANTARLAIVGDNPMLLANEDPAKVGRASKANSLAYQPALEKIVNFETDNGVRMGVIDGDSVVDVHAADSKIRKKKRLPAAADLIEPYFSFG